MLWQRRQQLVMQGKTRTGGLLAVRCCRCKPHRPPLRLPPRATAQRLQDRIKQQYRVRLILDNLPITTYDLELDPESGARTQGRCRHSVHCPPQHGRHCTLLRV